MAIASRVFFMVGVICIGVYPLHAVAQSQLPTLDPNQFYCVYTKDGNRSCALGKKLEITNPVGDIESIKSHKRRTLLGAGIGLGVGLASGITLLVAGLANSGNCFSEGDSCNGAPLSIAIIGAPLLIISGPIVGGLIGRTKAGKVLQTVYPIAGTDTAGLGISKQF